MFGPGKAATWPASQRFRMVEFSRAALSSVVRQGCTPDLQSCDTQTSSSDAENGRKLEGDLNALRYRSTQLCEAENLMKLLLTRINNISVAQELVVHLNSCETCLEAVVFSALWLIGSTSYGLHLMLHPSSPSSAKSFALAGCL